MVLVWSLPGCVQCTATMRDLTKRGIPFESRALDENPEQLAAFKAAGLVSAPVVEAGGEVWTGYRPERIAALAAKEEAA